MTTMNRLTFGFLTLNLLPEGNVTAKETIEAAADAGFDSVGLRFSSRHVNVPYIENLEDPATFAGVKQALRASGIRLSNVIGYGFFHDIPFEAHQRVIDMSAEAGAEILAGNFYDEDEDRLADTLARYAEYARRQGLRVAAEQMPFSSIKTVAQLKRLVEKAGSAENLGFMVDALHLHRSGGTVKDIASLEAKKIWLSQICDAPYRSSPPPIDELRREARSDRYYPGKGSLPLFDFFDALPEGIEIEFEIPRPDEGHLTSKQRTRNAADAFRAFMQRYYSRNKASAPI